MTDSQIRTGVYNCPNCGAAATPQSVRCNYCHSSLATLVCSKCYGAIFLGMKHCPWCGENADGGKPVGNAPGQCPRCSVDLLIVMVSKNTLSECPACGGLWVDNDTLQEICTSQEQQQAVMGFHPESIPANGTAPAPNARAYVPCPKCGKLMNRRQFAGCSRVVVDWCKAHGAWFDRDELRQVVQFILDGGMTKSRERELNRLEEARQKLRDERLNLQALSRMGTEADLVSSRGSLDADLFTILGSIWHAIKNSD
jgi:Zn-finger nucleic acid-binding protein